MNKADIALPRCSDLTRPTTPVFFRVLHLRSPKLPPLSDPTPSSSPDSWEARARRGDFGCLIDPGETMIVQAGSGKGLGVGGSYIDWLGTGASFLDPRARGDEDTDMLDVPQVPCSHFL